MEDARRDAALQSWSRRHGGARIKHRNRSEMDLSRLIADISAENHQRLRELAAVKGLSQAQWVDQLIERDWKRRVKAREEARVLYLSKESALPDATRM